MMIPKESLTFSQIPCEIGKYDLVSIHPNNTYLPTVNYSTIIEDGDVLGDAYEVVPDAANFIEITNLTDGDKVFGEFHLTMYRDTTRVKTTESTLDTIRFMDGLFHTRLEVL